MALWQFDFELMPRPVVANAPNCINSAITEDGLDTTQWWTSNQPDSNYARMIAAVFPPRDSCSPEILRWGDEDNVLIEAFVSGGLLEGIGVRIDVRNADRESIAKMIQLIAELDCQIYVMETGQIVAPDLVSLLPHLAKSKAVEFAHNPQGFIERLARENAT
jgi:hypothetical protein